MNKHLGIITGIMFLVLFCSCGNQLDGRQDTICPIATPDMESLFKGIELVIYRPGRDTHNLVYCLSFQNGKRCNIQINQSYEDGFFFNIEGNGTNPNKHSLNKEKKIFKEEYGCDVAQIKALVRFCRKNKFISVAQYDNNICCHTNRSMLFFYSMDSIFHDETKYKSLGQNWFTPR